MLALIVSAITFLLIPTTAQATLPPVTFGFTFDDYGNNTFPNQTSSTASLTPAGSCPADPCNATTAFGTDSNYGSYWEWTSTANRGGGFTVDTTGLIGDSYSIAMTFTLGQVTGWRKIIDYQNRVSDTGFYVLSGALQFYPKPTASFTFAPNQLINIVAVRDATTNPSSPTFKVYLAGPNGSYSEVYSFVDSTNMAVPYSSSGHTILGFFFDDTATGSEASNTGRIYDLKMWQNTVLTSSELNEVYTQAIAQPSASASPSASNSASPSASASASPSATVAPLVSTTPSASATPSSSATETKANTTLADTGMPLDQLFVAALIGICAGGLIIRKKSKFNG